MAVKFVKTEGQRHWRFIHSSGVWGESCGNPSRKRSPAQPSLKLPWMAGGSSSSGRSPERLSRRNTLVSLPLLHHNTLNLICGRARAHALTHTYTHNRLHADLLVEMCDCPRYSPDIIPGIYRVLLTSRCQKHLHVISQLVLLCGCWADTTQWTQ